MIQCGFNSFNCSFVSSGAFQQQQQQKIAVSNADILLICPRIHSKFQAKTKADADEIRIVQRNGAYWWYRMPADCILENPEPAGVNPP
jgi:hypothetical protein